MYHNLFRITLLSTAIAIILAACSASVPTSVQATESPIATDAILNAAEIAPTNTPIPSATATPELLPISAEASTYLEEALDIMQNNSLHRDSINWQALRESAFKIAEHAQTLADTYGAIRYALGRLGDHHSFFLTPSSAAQAQQATTSDSPQPRGKLLLDKLGYIAVEEFASPIPKEGSKYATTLQQLIRDLDKQEPCGWIVDLRGNTGGNMWPMLAGLGPILGEGEVGAFIDPDGHKEIWSYQDGQALVEEYVAISVSEPAYELKADPPVAVLTGVSTASSGEAMVVAFRGRPNTRSFGRYTTGIPTANDVFPLSDGAWVVLTVAVFADRTGQTYGDRIYPDELVDDVRKFTFIMDEAIPQPAIDWLLSQSACTVRQ